ncbi:MAG: site-specific integrase [Gammaproteobacteria bacterium]|nr:site-specific integrase [Gammaproteobacteria bacterium]
MENPLIFTPNKLNLPAKTGRDTRTQKRAKNDELIIRKALAILESIVPGILLPIPDAEHFNQRWPEVDQKLRTELPNTAAYRKAYAWICKQLAFGNQKGLWSIEVPPPYITLRAKRPTRSLRRHIQATRVAQAHATWLKNLTQTTSPKRLLERILISAIMHGGLNRAKLWPELLNTLQQAYPLHGNVSVCWLTLQLPPDSDFASNVHELDKDTGEKIATSQVNFFPDPITLGLIKQYLDIRPEQSEKIITFKLADCIKLINTKLETRFNQSELAWGGITVAEVLLDVALPQTFVEYATGRIPSSSLPLHYWERLIQPALVSCSENHYEHFNRFPALAFSSRKTTERPLLNSNLLHTLSETLKDDRVANKSKAQRIRELVALVNMCQEPAEQVLINWIISHLQDRGNAVSTARRYVASIAAEWLIATDKQDIKSFGQEDFFELYTHILNRPLSQKELHYRAARLEDMHHFGVQTAGFPPLPEPLLQEGSSTVIPHVSAAIVDEPLFAALCNHFACFEDLHPSYIATLQGFLIIAYRTGMRPGEIAKLRLCDIEPSPTAWIFVRANRHGGNKTAAALRKIPLFPLLTETEKGFIADFIQHKRMNSSATDLLFHEAGNPLERIDTKALSIAVRKVLYDLTGGLHYTQYHLRHSALSRLQLLLHHDLLSFPPELDSLLPYSQEQRQQLLIQICGKNRLRDRYWCLAALAGHSTPAITLSTYLHFTDAILGLYLKRNSLPLSKSQASVLLDIRPNRIKNMRQAGDKITPAHLSEHLLKKIKKYLNKPQKRQTAQTTTDVERATLYIKYTPYEKALAVLEKIQAGYDIRETVYFYNITEKEVKNWKRSAEALRSLSTKQGASRLFPKSRIHQLLPAPPVDTSEKKDLAFAFQRCRNLMTKNADAQALAELCWAIQHTLTNVNSSHSGINFDSAETLKRYMELVAQIIAWPRWHLELKSTDCAALNMWRINPLKVVHKPMKQQGRFLHGVGTLRLRHPEEKQRTEEGKKGYSSSTLLTLFHRLAIVLFTPEQISAWENNSDENLEDLGNHFAGSKDTETTDLGLDADNFSDVRPATDNKAINQD